MIWSWNLTLGSFFLSLVITAFAFAAMLVFGPIDDEEDWQ